VIQAPGNFMKHRSLIMAAGLIGGFAAASVARRTRPSKLRNKVVFVSGGSRGLGLLLAREFCRRGARVAISARDADELGRAAKQLEPHQVLTIAADMTVREQVVGAIEKTVARLGPVDVLVNNAGTITVGPVATMTIEDYRESLAVHFWGPYFATEAVIHSMRQRASGRIVNISSIGGKISVPHLLPYCVGKFALTGFSEGLRSELLKDNVYVTTVCPGLMRTGSPRNAFFKGKNEAEYAWFSISDALPLISISAERAARRIVDACVRGEAEVVLSLPAKLATKMHALFPSAAIDLLGVINRLLPSPGGVGTDVRKGKESFSTASPSWITVLDERAAQRNNQIA
jgi:short-subunit dehydrogenase